MQPPPIPPDEEERLETLEKLKILDTPPEERFNRIVRLTARVLDVPITAISLVDRDRQWFKAKEGLDAAETSRDVSFCGHAILASGPLVIEDARRDARFADNPLVTGPPNTRFYAGQRLRVGKHFIGVLCAIDRRPRHPSDEQLALLADLGALAERELQLDSINALRQKIDHANREKQKLEHELERFFSLPIDLLSIARPDGTFKRLSAAWPSTLGWSEQELLERPFIDFVHPDDRDATIAETQHLSEGGRSVAFENRYRRRDGSYRWFLWNAVGSRRDKLIYATARDISELKRMQALKNEFVSIVSHELRTPLTSIRGSVDLLASGVAGELPAEASSLIDVARNNCKRLSRLINDILDIEKVEAGQLQFKVEPHPIVALVKRALEDNAQFASRRSVSFQLVDSIPEMELNIDADRLHQVLTNLLSNAAKFEPAGGSVEIRVSRKDGAVRISICDHGAGIPAEFQSRVFEKFAQADGSDRREKGGTGLGLSISKAIVERLGGTIGFTTEEGRGTKFSLELPCRADSPALQRATDLRPRVLVVEDDRDVAYVLKLTLDRAGFATDVAPSLERARELLRGGTYHAITVDLVLPDGDGFSLIRELREHASTRALPVIVVSVRANEARTELNGGALDVVDWLPKPIDQERLLRAVRQASELTAARKPRILHVEDDVGILLVTARLLGDVAELVGVTTIADAKRALGKSRFSLVILDWRLPDGVGAELLPLINEQRLRVVLFSAHDVPRGEAEQAADVLVKSRVSSAELRSRIVDLVRAEDPVTV